MRRGLLAASLSGVLLSMSVPALVACSRAEERPPVEELIYAPEDDAKVNAAMLRARETLPVFWAKFEAAQEGYDAFSLKVALPTRSGGAEHIWIEEIERDGANVKGRLANEPFDLKGLSIGSKVQAAPTQISDWQYRKGGKLYGHFTTRALTERANAEQRAEAAELFAPTPLEPEAN